MAKKPERVKMYNKGKRNWPLKDNGKDVNLAPGKSIELNKDHAEKLVKNYPFEFLLGEPVVKVNDSKKLKARVAELEKLLVDYDKRIADMSDEISIFEEKVASLEFSLAEATKPKE